MTTSVFADRRKRLLESLADAVLVVPAAPVAIRNNDVEHEYRQDSDVYYVAGFTEPGSVLVLAPGHAEHRYVLFVRPRDPEREVWDGARAGVEGAVADFGADAAFPIGELGQRLPEYLAGHDRLVYRFGRDPDVDAHVLAAIGACRGKARTGVVWPAQIVDPALVLHEMRLRKDPGEIDKVRQAARITAEAHVGAMRLSAPGRWEYEVEALLREVFRKRGSERPAYPPIVGSGPNATVLHYRANGRRMQAGELLLVDAGCEVDYYAADVTRTWPVDGRFSGEQRAVYEIVLHAQAAAIDAIRPGSTLDAAHQAAVRTIVEGLLDLGLLSGSLDEIVEKNEHKRFYMHRTSHWLGLDVHDVGTYYRAREPRALEAGMVLTVEPGIYVSPADAAAPDAFRGIGVRIEDDVLVTPEGCAVLTADVPKSVADVERACAG